MCEHLIRLPRKLEAQPDVHILLHLEKHATRHCVFTVSEVTSARFSSGIGCLSLLLLSTGISTPSLSFPFLPLLPPALAADSILQRAQAVVAVARPIEAEAAGALRFDLSFPCQRGQHCKGSSLHALTLLCRFLLLYHSLC